MWMGVGNMKEALVQPRLLLYLPKTTKVVKIWLVHNGVVSAQIARTNSILGPNVSTTLQRSSMLRFFL